MFTKSFLSVLALFMMTVALAAQDPPTPPTTDPPVRQVPEQGFEPGKPAPTPLRPAPTGEAPAPRPNVRPGDNASPTPPAFDPRTNDRPTQPGQPAPPTKAPAETLKPTQPRPPASKSGPNGGKSATPGVVPAIPRAGWRWIGAERRLVEKKIWIPGGQELICEETVQTYFDPCGNCFTVVVPVQRWITTPGRWVTRTVVEEVRAGKWIPPAELTGGGAGS